MGLFNSIFKESTSGEGNLKIDWLKLTDIHQLTDIDEISKNKVVVIFKHSTRCSISRIVLNQFEKNYEYSNSVVAFYLDLLAYRNISNQIELQFKTAHQSPQLLIIKNGITVFSDSHNNINAEDIKKFI